MFNPDSYYDPPDYGQGEIEVSESVYCETELCNDFEKEVEWSGTADWYGGRSEMTIVISYTCPTCGLESTHERTREIEEYDPDAGRDDY